MLLAMLIPILAFALMQKTELPTGSNLYRQCKSYIGFLDGTNIRQTTPAELIGAGRCLGFIDGFIEGSYAKPNGCADNATVATIIRVYLLYMEKHPKMMDDLEPIGVALALQDAYPCNSK